MASTNKTTHYELSQYIGTDKPTYLVDYNNDMSTIDTAIYNAKSEADTNSNSIGNLSNLETEVKTDLVSAINEVENESNTNTSNIGNLSNLTTEATNSLVSAINEVDAEADSNNQNIGNMVNLETTVKTSLVGAINEVNSALDSKASTDIATTTNDGLMSSNDKIRLSYSPYMESGLANETTYKLPISNYSGFIIFGYYQNKYIFNVVQRFGNNLTQMKLSGETDIPMTLANNVITFTVPRGSTLTCISQNKIED